jgi:hypothetical protein
MWNASPIIQSTFAPSSIPSSHKKSAGHPQITDPTPEETSALEQGYSKYISLQTWRRHPSDCSTSEGVSAVKQGYEKHSNL